MPAKQEFGTSPIENPAAPPAPPPAPVPQYEDSGRLTYASLSDIVRRGGSVVYQGRIIASAAQLPTEADYAKAGGKREDVARVQQNLQSQIAALQSQLNGLTAAQPQPQQGAAATVPSADANAPKAAEPAPQPAPDALMAADVNREPDAGDKPHARRHR